MCGYVRLIKGDDFVQQAITQRPPVLPASVSMIGCSILHVFRLMKVSEPIKIKVYEPFERYARNSPPFMKPVGSL
jgi:hypothetical protein